MKLYKVHIKWKSPAWDEQNGDTILVYAKDKRGAIKRARKEAGDAGIVDRLHPATFKAEEAA